MTTKLPVNIVRLIETLQYARVDVRTPDSPLIYLKG